METRLRRSLSLGQRRIQSKESEPCVASSYRRQNKRTQDQGDLCDDEPPLKKTTTTTNDDSNADTGQRDINANETQLGSVSSRKTSTSTQNSQQATASDTIHTASQSLSRVESRVSSNYVAPTDSQLSSNSNFRPPSSCQSDANDSHESMVLNVNPNLLFDDDTENDATQSSGQTTQISEDIIRPAVNKRRRTLGFRLKKRYPKKLPYDKILSHVTFALSGYENPRRSRLKELAIKMGAKYVRHYNNTCTHLICAFKFTSQYMDCKDTNGRVVREHWLQDCSDKGLLLDWRSYKLGKYPYSDSEEDLFVDELDQVTETIDRGVASAPPATRLDK